MTTVYAKQNNPHPESILHFVWYTLLKRKILLFSLVIIIILLPVLYLVIRYQPKIEAAWMDDSFAYRQRVDITNAGAAQTDFQVVITLNTSALITAGKMQSDCDDIRITDVNGKVLPVWIETGTNACNTTTTAIWTKVPAISTTGTTVFLYYGNGSVTNTQNGNNVFIYFDDFNDYALGALPTGGKWTWESSVVSPTIVDDSGAKSLRLVPQSTGEGPILFNQGTVTNTVIQARVRDANNSHYHIGRHSSLSSPVGDNGQGFWIYPGNINLYRNNAGYNSFSSISQANRAVSLTTYHNYKVTANGSSWAIYEDGASSPTHSGTEGTYASGYPTLMTYASENMYVDFFFVRTFSATEPTVASPINEERSQGPVAYWKFDEGYGTTAHDSAPNAIDGSFGTGALYPTWANEDSCISGKCIYIPSTNKITTSKTLTLPTQFTISNWIRTSAANGQAYSVFNAPGGNGYRFGISGGRVAFLIGNSGGYTETTCGTTLVNDNKWHLITGVYQSADKFYCYIDGKFEASVNIVDFTGMQNAGPTIGGYNTAQQYTGYLDEIKIYNYARSTAQIKADYASKSSGSVKGVSAQMGTNVKNSDTFSNGLVGYWKMDEASGNTLDSSGNSNTGVPTNTTVVSGKFGNSRNTTTNGLITVTDATSLDFNTSNFSAGAWVYVDSTSVATNQEYGVINKNTTYQNSAGWGFEISSYGKSSPFATLNIQAFNSGQTNWCDTCASKSDGIPTNVWNHIFMIRKDGVLQLYINGELISTNSHAQVVTNVDNAVNLIIGDHSWGPNFPGKIDDVRIYNRSLSPKEVRDLYNWAPGPIGYWNMDENTGVSAYDSSSNGLTGTLNSSPSWTNGKYSSAVTFNGSTQYIGTVANPTALQTTTGTICAWINPSAITSYHGIFSYQKDYGTGVYGYAFGLRSNGFAFLIGDNTGYYEQFGISTVSVNAWTYGCLAYSPSNIKVYKNGLEIGNYTPTKTAQFYSGNNARIGHLDNDHNYGFNGSIDDVRVYNYMRSSKQIVEDMNASHPAGGSPVGSQYLYYRFDEGYGTTTSKDSSPNGLDATISNTSWSNEGKFGKALSFNGTSARTTNASFSTPNSITATAWIKHNISTGYKWVLGKETALTIGIGPSTVYGYVHDGTTGGSDGNGWNNCSPASVSISPNEWHYVALSYNNREQKIYLDGKLLKTCTFSPTGDSDGNVDAGSGNFTVGDLGARGVYFSGLIDEVKVYNSALTEDEIKLDYNQGSAMVLGTKIEDTNDNPVGYWKLDEANGTTVNNYGSCSTCNGTSASITYGSGKVNGSYDMQPSSTDYWYVPANATLDVDSKFTIEAWGTYDTNGRYGLFANNTVENQFNVYTSGTTVAVLGTTLSGGAVAAGQWFHTAVTYDGTSYRLYVNGILVSTDSTTGIRDFSGCWVFGQEVDGAGLCSSGFDSGQAWDGKIDEVKIYNYVRSSSQITADAATDSLNPSLPGAPIAEWKLDENTGVNAYDTSGNGNTGTLGGSTSWTTGNVGAALKFSDSTDDKITFSNSVLNTPPYTVCTWAKPDSITDGDYHYVIANGGESGGLYGFFIYLNNTGTWLFGVRNSSGLTGSASIAATNTNWTYVCGTWDGTSTAGAVKLYVNGSLAPTGTAAGASAVSAANLKIGGASSTDTYNWDGKIDHIKIYNYVRTPAQIAYDYNRGGPVGYWRLDECQGGTAYDSSGNGNNGTITIGPTPTQTSVGTCTTSGTAWGNGVNGKYSNSLNFDGSDDYVDLGSGSSLNTTAQLSISYWVKYNSGGELGLARTWDTWRFYSNPLNIYNVRGGSYSNWATNWSYSTATWYHIGYTYDGTSEKLFINGNLQDSRNVSGILDSSGNLYIGSRPGLNGFNGQLDDVKIFNYSLSTEQIKNLYNAGASVQFAPITGIP